MAPKDEVAAVARRFVEEILYKPRVRADITLSEFCWTVFAVFLMGTLFGWGAFGEQPFPSDALEKTSVADFFAAAGTWIIGYGAWKYARANHQHQVDEARRIAAKHAQTDLIRISLAIDKIELVPGVRAAVGSLNEKGAELTPAFARYGLKRVERRLARIVLTDAEKETFSDEHLRILRNFEQYLETANARIEDLFFMLQGCKDGKIGEDFVSDLASTFKRTQTLESCAEEFSMKLKDHKLRVKAWVDTDGVG